MPTTTVPNRQRLSSSECQERAFVAASRRPDRSIDARLQSGLAASDIHFQRTKRTLNVTRDAVMNDEMYEEIDHKEKWRASHRKSGTQKSLAPGANKRNSYLDCPTRDSRAQKRKADAMESQYDSMDHLFRQLFPSAATMSTSTAASAPPPAQSVLAEDPVSRPIERPAKQPKQEMSKPAKDEDEDDSIKTDNNINGEESTSASTSPSLTFSSSPTLSPTHSSSADTDIQFVEPQDLQVESGIHGEVPATEQNEPRTYKAAFSSPAEAALAAAEAECDNWHQHHHQRQQLDGAGGESRGGGGDSFAAGAAMTWDSAQFTDPATAAAIQGVMGSTGWDDPFGGYGAGGSAF